MHSTTRHIYGLIITLFIIGLSLFGYRHVVLDVPLTDNKQINSWTIEANLRFIAEPNVPVKANFSIPYTPLNFAIINEYFVSHNYGVTTNLTDNNRQVVWSLRRTSGKQSLFYRVIFRESDNIENTLQAPPPLKAQTLSENKKTAADTLINEARQTSADIQTLAQSTIQELNKKEGNAKILVNNNFSERNIVNAAITVLNQAKIHAQLVQGIYLKTQTKADFRPYLAVYNEKEWIYINPKTGVKGLPKNYLIWQYGQSPMYEVSGGTQPTFSITASPTPLNALSAAKARGLQAESQLLRFSLLQLPINAQDAYKIILTVPVGAFIILLLRNFIGLSTFGTFMPVLIALAFRETHVIWGIILFSFIVSLGLLVRFYLDQLRLLLVPRLGAVLTVVILIMMFISIIGQNLGLDSGLSVALFPMVILTMTIERMCVTWDERGPYDAIKDGIGSLIAATITYGVINYAPLQYLLFAFPELLLVVLALILLFGQYRGYRLFELIRFKALTGKS